MTEHLDLDEIEERAERAMRHHDTLPPRAAAADCWFVLRELADIVPDLLAEVRRLASRLAFLDGISDDEASGWCDCHPRRVEASTAGMIGRDTTDGADICLACEVERLEAEVRRLRALLDEAEESKDYLSEAAVALLAERDEARAEVRRLRAACGSPIPRDTGESLADVRLRTAFDGEGGQP